MYQNNERPTAFISVNKGRRKVKDGKFVYLQNGQEFEIELYNPTSQVVMAKIEMNGKPISSSGIVLRPGERVFLERFLDNSNKFKFDTYEVSSGGAEVKKAIEKNGTVKVNFYNEDSAVLTTTNTYEGPNIRTWPNNDIYTYYNNTQPYGSDVFGATSASVSSFSYSADMNQDIVGDATLGLASLDSVNVGNTPRRKSKSKKMETGRVEKGEASNQTFDSVDKKFYSYTTNVVEYQIKPLSQMVMTAKEAVTTSKYCTDCGKKANYKHKFCANCGSKL